MAMKGKKRALNNSEKSAISETANVPQQSPPKNMKAGKKQKQSPSKKPKAENVQVQPAKQKAVETLPGQSPPKKPKIEKPESSLKAETKPEGKTLSAAALAKRKEKKERRKQRRQAEGQYKPENLNTSEEDLASKIAKLESLETKSKTARRKLAVLKKKLKIQQGVYEPPAPMATKQPKKEQKVSNNSKTASIPSNNTKQNSTVEKKAKLDKPVSPAASKGQNAKKNNVGNNKKMEKPEKKIVKKEAEASDDDEDDEEADESMDVSNVSAELDESKVEDNENDDEEDEENDDDEDEDDDEKEENDDVKQPEAEEEDKEDDEEEKKQEDDAPSAKNKKLPAKKPNNQSPKNDDQKKKRFVLFVGNLAYSATVDDIKKHFLTKVSNVTSVRIPINPQTRSPRGIAFVEFANSVDYEKALSLHNSTINGRMISVQYSSGGSKTVNNRPEIVAKNKKLHAMRKQGKLAGSVKESQKRNVRRNKFKSQE